MRHFSALAIIAALAALQFGVGYAAVCRTLMPAQATASGHCAKETVPSQAERHCNGMAGCAELCRGNASELPTTPGKEAPQVSVHPGSAVWQVPDQGPFHSGGWTLSAPRWRIADSSRGQPPQAFILFHTLLI